MSQYNYEEIVDSFVNGQITQMVKQIEAFGWYDFATAIEHDVMLSDAEKVQLLARALRADNR